MSSTAATTSSPAIVGLARPSGGWIDAAMFLVTHEGPVEAPSGRFL